MDNKKTHNNTVDSELLFRFFNNAATEDEENLIDVWLRESQEHKEIYSNARDLYETFLMTAPIGMIEGHPAIPENVVRKRNILRMTLRAVSGIAAAAAIFFCSSYITDYRYENRLANTMNTIYVPAGKSMDYTLNDGTVIKLNSGARLQYPMAFAKDIREVRLDGEAYFDVAHNPEQPFIVRTFASDIEVLGTEFNVNADEENKMFSTTLIEGSVKLTSKLNPGREIFMHPDQTVRLIDGKLAFENKSSKAGIRWTKGILDISGLTFTELMKKLELAFGTNIIIDCKDIPELEYTSGELWINEGLESALKVIQKGADFTYVKDRRTGSIIIK